MQFCFEQCSLVKLILMEAWLELDRTAERSIEQARQLYIAGRNDDAGETLMEVISGFPYSATARYELYQMLHRSLLVRLFASAGSHSPLHPLQASRLSWPRCAQPKRQNREEFQPILFGSN